MKASNVWPSILLANVEEIIYCVLLKAMIFYYNDAM